MTFAILEEMQSPENTESKYFIHIQLLTVNDFSNKPLETYANSDTEDKKIFLLHIFSSNKYNNQDKAK